LSASIVRFGSWLRENVEIEFANGNFVSTSINLKNKSAGEGCRDKTIEKTILRAFRARTFSRSQGQNRKSSMRAYDFRVAPESNTTLRTRCDRFVPRRDMPLFDNLVRTGHQRGWNLDAKFLRSLEVNE
jgi:hypothetical protein